MAELVVGTTAALVLTPPPGDDVSLASVTVKNLAGADIAHTVDDLSVVIHADALNLGDRITATAVWDITTVAGVQHRTTTATAWVLLDDHPGYGSIEGVSRLLTMISLSATSTPNVTQAAETAGMQRRMIDARLAAGGIGTPLTNAGVVADAENLLTAASLLESILMAHGNDGSTTVETWRKQAESVLKPICDGKMDIPGSQPSTTQPPASNPAGVSNTSQGFTDEAHTQFVDTYGGDMR
jgi:hypothetical protein